MSFQTKQTFVIDASDAENNISSLKLEDITNLTSLGLDETEVDSVFKVTDPTGEVIHLNTDYESPDIDYDVSRVFTLGSLNEDIATDAPVQGVYNYEMNTRTKNSGSYNFSFISATAIKISQVLLIDESIDVSINAVLGGGAAPNAGTYTIVSVTYDSSGFPTINLGSTLPDVSVPTDEAATLGTISYEQTLKSFSYIFSYPELSIEAVSDCDYGTIEFTDNTLFAYDIGTDTRIATIKYPENAVNPPSDVVFSSQSKKLSELYTGTYSFVVERSMQFILDAKRNTYVESTLIASKAHLVDCSESLCCITGCYESLIKRYEDALCTDQSKAASLGKQLLQISSKIQLARLIRYCGQTGYRTLLTQIKNIFGETGCDCGCDENPDGLSRKVTPVTAVLGGSGLDATFVSPDGSISITSIIAGTTTNYNLQLSSELAASLQGEDGASFIVITGDPGSLAQPLGTVALNESNGDLWERYNNSGTLSWQVVGNILGEAVRTVEGDEYIEVDDSDAENILVTLTAGVISILAAAQSASQPGDNLSSFANDVGFAVEAYQEIASQSGPTYSIDLALGNNVYVPFANGDLEFAATNMLEGQVYRLSIRNNGVETNTISWDTDPFVFAPEIDLASGATAGFTFIGADIGGDVYLLPVGSDYAIGASESVDLPSINVGPIGSATQYDVVFADNKQFYTINKNSTGDLDIQAPSTANIVEGRLYVFNVKAQFGNMIVTFGQGFTSPGFFQEPFAIKSGNVASFTFIGSNLTQSANALYLISNETSRVNLESVSLPSILVSNTPSFYQPDFNLDKQHFELSVTSGEDIGIAGLNQSGIVDGRIYVFTIRNFSTDIKIQFSSAIYEGPENLALPEASIPAGKTAILTFIGIPALFASAKMMLISTEIPETSTYGGVKLPVINDGNTFGDTAYSIDFSLAAQMFTFNLGTNDLTISTSNSSEIVDGRMYVFMVQNSSGTTRTLTLTTSAFRGADFAAIVRTIADGEAIMLTFIGAKGFINQSTCMLVSEIS